MSGLEQFDEELYAIDVRIARLAIACGVDIGRKDNIVSLIKGQFDICRRGANIKRGELRALLMLKYRIQENCVGSMGTDQCLRLVEEEEARLRRQGFRIAAERDRSDP